MSGEGPFREDPDEHVARIRRIVRGVARDESDLDDLAQECCVRVLERERLWRPQGIPFPHWLSRVARNFALNRGRDRSRRKEALVEDPDLYPAPTAPTGDEIVSEEQIRKVMGQFRRLTPGQRRILQMRYFEGKRTGVIAKELGITSEAVSMQLKRALDRLRRRMGVGAFLAWLFTFGWLREAKVWAANTSATAVAAGGTAMKAKYVAAAGILGMAFFGHQAYEQRQELKQAKGDAARVAGLSKDLEQAHSRCAALVLERDSALAAAQAAHNEKEAGLAAAPPSPQAVRAAEKPGTGSDHPMGKILLCLKRVIALPATKKQLLEQTRGDFAASWMNILKERGYSEEAIQQAAAAFAEYKYDGMLLFTSVADPSVPADRIVSQKGSLSEAIRTKLAGILGPAETDSLLAQEDQSTNNLPPQFLVSLHLDKAQRDQVLAVSREEWPADALWLQEVLGGEVKSSEQVARLRKFLSVPIDEGLLQPQRAHHQRVLDRCRSFLPPEQLRALEKAMRRGLESDEQFVEMTQNMSPEAVVMGIFQPTYVVEEVEPAHK